VLHILVATPGLPEESSDASKQVKKPLSIEARRELSRVYELRLHAVTFLFLVRSADAVKALASWTRMSVVATGCEHTIIDVVI
jgi:hypothetical protein